MTRVCAPCTTRYVWFTTEMHTSQRRGSMLHCVWKPTRQPLRSPPAAVVTTSIGKSSDCTIV